MKKLLVLLALLLALTLVFIACDKNKNPVTDTTVDDQTTEEPTQDVEDPTAAPTDPEETTEEPTEAPTQEDPTDAPTEKPTEKPEDPTEPPATQEPETDDPMEPVNVFGPEDIQTVTGGDPSNMTQDCLTLEDGFIHVVPIGPDPYWYPFAGVDGARYVAIRYRTDATGADIQMYIGSTGNGPTDDSTMLRQPVIADSEWHVAIFDTQSLIEAGKYDGKYVSYFRFDALEAGYILDENGQPYKPDGVNYARYTLPEGCSIDVAYIGFFHNEDAVAKYDFEQYPPFAQPGDAGLKSNSFDTFYVNGQMYFPDGGADAKLDEINNTLTFGAASELQNIALRGWIGFNQAIDQFGYYVDNYEFIFGEFKQATEDGVLTAGGEFATRFQINVDLSYLEGDDHFVGFVVKLADGTIVQLREEIVIDLPELPKDITDSFTSDVSSNEIGTTLDASDLSNFFVPELPLAGSGVEANGDGKLYNLTSINDFYTDVNGRYFFKANIVDTNGAGWMFVRGYRVVNSDEIIEKFDPDGGIFKINNYYETDSAGAMGGAGIYARLQSGKLFIMVKAYDPACVTRVMNKTYFIEAAGTELTMADNGATVSIMVDGVTYATVALSGSITYGDINEVDPAGEFAEKAVITLKDGTTETIENTLIAATCKCQIGAVSRAGLFKFDAMSVGGYSAVEVPALEIVTPEPEEPADPNAPAYIIAPEFINSQALSTGGQTFTNHIASSEVITEDGVTFVKLTVNGGDPYVTLVNIGSMLELPQYMAVSYKTNSANSGQLFIGSGAGWSGKGDVVSGINWNEDGNWNNMILDLANVGLTSIQGNMINYARFDFFAGNGAEGDYFAVEYVAFFNTAEAAENYFNKLHGIEIPTEPEVTEPQEPETTEPQEPETEEPKPEPEFYEDWTVDLSTLAGHLPNWDAAGYGTPIVKFGYNSVYDFGTVDFSKYSSIVIEYSYDGKNGDVAADFANSASAPGFGFSTVKGAFGYANVKNQEVYDNGVFGEIECNNTMMWATSIKTLVIDISELTYNGQVYLSAFNPWGREMVISSIKFIGAEKPVETEPQEPETTEPQEPETEEPKPEVAYKNETITLAERAGGGPFGSTKTFGQRYNIGENILKTITVENMATYDDGNVNTWSLKVWQWNTDYATTVAAEPLFVKLGENHANNTHFSVLIEGVEIKGDFYYEVEYLTGSKQFTGWTANGTVIEGLQTYAGGQLKDNHYAASIIIGVPYDPNAPIADITNKFESNVGANAEGTDIRDSDLKNYFTIVYGAADPHKVAGGMYQFGGINEMFAKADGLYAFSANIQGAVIMQDTLFVRGYHAVNFPQNPTLLVNNYYEDDGNGSTGGAGIYVTISNDVLYIVVKAFNPANSKGIQNHVYQMPANGGTNVTIADDGKVVYVILEGKLAATIALSGETTYNEIVLPLDPGCGFAKTAVVTLADGTTATIENTLVASNYISQFGVVARGGQINFWSLSVKGFSEIEIPEFPHVHNYNAVVTDPTCTEGGYTTYTCECGDSYVADETAAAGHNHEAVVTDPTCTEGGYTTYTCECGDSYIADETAAAGHNFIEGACGICGAADPDYVAPVPSTPEEIVNAAYGLAEGATLEGTFTLTGVITSIDSAYNAQYGNISVWMVIGNMTDKPILAYRLSGAGVESLKVGDTITVTGTLTNYYSKIEFTQGCTLDAVVPGEEPEPEIPDGNTITIDFADKANRTEFNANVQVWGNGDFILTNNKSASTTEVADYANPARFYAHSELVFSGVSMTKLVFACDASKYVTALNNTLASASGITVTTEGMVVTVVFDTPVDTFVLADLTAQIRLDSVTVYVAAAEEPEAPAGNEIVVTTTDTYGYFDEYTFVATASGTYTFTVPAGLGFFAMDDYNAYKAPLIDFYDNENGYTFSIDLAEGAEYAYLVGALTKGEWTITYTFVEGEVGGDEPVNPDEPEVEIPTIVVGNNTVNVTDAIYAEGGFEATFVAEAEGTYNFTGDFLIRIYNENGMQMGTGTAYLPAGTYTLQIVTAWLAGAGTYNLPVEFVAPEEPETPDPEQPGEPGVQDGTQDNPYVLTDINTELSFDDVHDVYYTYTSDSVMKINIFYTEGCYVSISGDAEWDKDEGAMMYTIVVFEGGTVVLNTWGNGAGTYTIVGGGKK